MDKRTILAIALSMGILLAWQKFYLEPIQQRAALELQERQRLAETTTKREENKAELDARGILPASERKKAEQAPKEVKTVVLENGDTRLSVSNGPALFTNGELKSYARALDKVEEKVTLEETTGFSTQVVLRFNDPKLAALNGSLWDSVEKVGDKTVVSRLSHPELNVERRFTLADAGYGGEAEYRLQFKSDPPKYFFLDLNGSPKRANDHEGSIFGQAPDKVHFAYRDTASRHSHMGAGLQENVETATGVKWLGVDTRYFVLALVPEGDRTGAQVTTVPEASAPTVRGSLAIPTEGKRDVVVKTKVYFGPKNMEQLRSLDPVLVDAIDFGWTSFLAVPLLQSLKWIHSYLPNYGLAIIILTFLIKMLLLPLTYKSMKSMAKIAKLQPQLTALREKYKDDKEKLNAEMMSFMRTNGYNPVGGCLPILLQMPIFFALYRVLFNSMELYQAPFIGWIHDLSAPDPFFVLPVLLTGLMYFQQKLSPNTATDPTQQKMMQFMPVMFGVFMILLPAGLNIYMVVNSATSIAQQWVLNKKLGIHPMQSVAVKA